MNGDSARVEPGWRALATILFTILIIAATMLAPFLLGIFYLIVDADSLAMTGISGAMTTAINSKNFLALNVLISLIVCVVLVFAVVKLKAGASVRRYLALKPVRLGQLSLWVGAVLVCAVLADFLMQFFGIEKIPQSMVDMWERSESAWLLAIAVVVAAPLWEELLFRGFLMRGLETSIFRGTGAVVIAAAIWTLLHVQYEWYYLVVIFVLGLLLGVARLATGSLYVPVAMHIAQNLLALVQIAIYREI